MTYVVLNYMKYQYHHWYAANLAMVICFVMYLIFLNVLQFEGYNRMNMCHPYFYTSSACRKLVAETIAANNDFATLKRGYVTQVYQDANQAIDRNVQTLSAQAQHSTAIKKLNDFVNNVQNLASSYLGNLRTEVNKAPPDKPSVLSQLKRLLDTTIVNPVLTKYIDPLSRLYATLSPVPTANAPSI